jgi:hypothetical protein
VLLRVGTIGLELYGCDAGLRDGMVGTGGLDDHFGDDGTVDWILEGAAAVALFVSFVEVVFLATTAWRLPVSALHQHTSANTRIRE